MGPEQALRGGALGPPSALTPPPHPPPPPRTPSSSATPPQDCVLGKSSEVMGGLFQFLDEVNNPARLATAETQERLQRDAGAAYRVTDAYALIVAHVNEVGQFVLRELLESGPSTTHWQQARKDRVLYLLDIPCACPVAATVQSRAQHIVYCE